MDRTSIQSGSLTDASRLKLLGIWFTSEAQPHLLLDDSVPHYEGNDEDADV